MGSPALFCVVSVRAVLYFDYVSRCCYLFVFLSACFGALQQELVELGTSATVNKFRDRGAHVFIHVSLRLL